MKIMNEQKRFGSNSVGVFNTFKGKKGVTVAKRLFVVGASATFGAVSSAMADASVTVPTPDYTTFYAVVGVGLAVTLIVGLARKSKGFLR